eukprot:CAMPEP_0197234810 /NCGR_PEP_ID=MMETSP1429-20130617/2458_1 /TAXON_ID=49237 /ORGANISM="Chaetoceros  sp., Strain UNC1202" /LENGTH=238 /DNA_ID=CAMNT_0042693301 /DNA_START=42 /DNA_END=758 /DNA_ORIENTATION=-
MYASRQRQHEYGEKASNALILQEAREEIRSQYDTTQVFISPGGDWTEQVYKDVTDHEQRRSCWIRGPYVSPYSIASNFSNLVLMASGIGITPALGVLGQYKGFSRSKYIVWLTRCPKMLKFFLPLLAEGAHLAVIYYTGKEQLSNAETKRLLAKGNIYIQQSKPDSLGGTISTIISATSSPSDSANVTDNTQNVRKMSKKSKKQWCIFYCGGSKRICESLKDYSTDVHITYEYELFDW